MRKTTIVIMATVAASLAFAAQKERPLYDDRFFEPVEEVVSPHIPWAKPYVSPPRVLFLTHRNAMREVVELAQRVSMDYRVFAMEAANKFGETGLGVDSSWKLIRGNSAEELAERLRQELAGKYDVIVAGGIDWDKLPLDCRYEILKQVKAGTGLVGCVRARDPYLEEILKTAEFKWNWGVWSGGAQGVADYFGVGVFTGGVDYAGGHTGQAAARIECTSVTKGSREAPRAGYSIHPIELEPNTEYTFSMWTKTRDLAAGGAIANLHPHVGGNIAVPVSDDWKQSTSTFKTNENPPKIGLYLLSYQPGTVWFDDMSLTKTGSNVNLLPNPGFEYPGPAPAELADGFAHQALPAFSKYPDQQAFLRGVFQTSTFGQGRIGLVSYGVPTQQMLTPGPTRPVQYCREDYDYYLQLATRLILWGAKKSPPVQVVTAQAMGEAGKELAVPVVLRSEQAMAKAMVAVLPGGTASTPRPPAASDSSLKGGVTTDLKPGENTISLKLGALPAGLQRVNVQVTSNGKVVGFGTVGVQVAGPVTIKSLDLSQPSFSLGEALKGKIVLEKQTAGAVAMLTARDNNGRLLGTAKTALSGAETEFSVPVLPATTIIGWLQADLVQGGATVASERRDFSLNNLYAPRDDVQFVMWQGYANTFLHPLIAESFSANGIDAFYDGGALGYGPYANQWWIPYATRFVDNKTDWYQETRTRQPGDLVRDPCLTDPAYRAKVKEQMSKCATRGLQVSTSDYTLGDENHFVAGNWDLCFSEHCNEDFRRWARQTYGTLEKLNASWGSQYTNWSDVKPQPLEEAKKTGNLVPWVDHRLHMETVWAGIHDYSREIIKQTVPQARVGYEGSDTVATSWQANDYWQLARAMDLNNIYYRDFLSLAVRDFSTVDTLLGAGWFGGYAGNRNEPFMRWFPWRTLFKGANSFWVWCGYGSAGAVMAFDTSMYPFFSAACEEVAQIKEGPGKLLMNTRRMHDGVALLWSNSSVHLATATPNFPDMDTTLNSLVMVLHDCGLEAKVLSYEEVKQGKLSNQEFKVLLLPSCQALSAAEVERIKAFVAGGGTVIADLRPAVTDEHGKPHPAPPLDEVFGVKQGAQFQRVQGELQGGPQLGLTSGDASLALGGGQAAAKLGEAPAIITQGFGKGKAILLNCSLRGYMSLPKPEGLDFAGWDAGAAYRGFLGGLMKAAGVEPPVRVLPEAPRVEVNRFRKGAAEYVGIVQSLPRDTIEYTNRVAPAPRPRAVTVDFGRKSHVYDVRAGKYLGETASVKTQLTPGVAQLYALLPYKVSGLKVLAPAQARAGQALTVDVQLGVPARPAEHVVRLTVTGPDGKERPWYAQNVTSDTSQVATTGLARGTLQLALDDAPGTWKITARDVASGATATATMKVTGP